MDSNRQTWTCRIGVTGTVEIPLGGDSPMRDAVEEAFKRVTGQAPEHCFSGWGDKWSEQQLAVIENRLPAESQAEIVTLRAERDRLRAALQKYGDHHTRCASTDDFKCDCGFDAVMIIAGKEGA